MLTEDDDYPVHLPQQPAIGANRNFSDRYFFNGYTLDGHVFFAAALRIYPHLNAMDAAFGTIVNGVQHNLRASCPLSGDTMEMRAGPIEIAVVEPFKALHIRVHDNEHGIAADLAFEGRANAVETPRTADSRLAADYRGLTQNGLYEGTIGVKGERIDVDYGMVLGTREHSWGVHPIPLAGPEQFYRLWMPLNFPDRFMLHHLYADASGKPWSTASVIGELGEAEPMRMASGMSDVVYKSGTRHAKSATVEVTAHDGRAWRADLSPRFNFYMSGIASMDSGQGHEGGPALVYDTYDLAVLDENDPRFQHVQAFVTARLNGPDGERVGAGVLDQLVLGPHAPSGFKGFLDPAP